MYSNWKNPLAADHACTQEQGEVYAGCVKTWQPRVREGTLARVQQLHWLVWFMEKRVCSERPVHEAVWKPGCV